MYSFVTFFSHISRYFKLVRKVFRSPQKGSIFYERILEEINVLIFNSIPIVAFSSLFTGAILTIQTAFNLSSPFIPKFMIGYATRETTFLEFSPTIISIVLVGKIGSSIATQTASMKISEQIVALEIMGVNSEAYTILPKVIVSVLLVPVLVLISMVVSILGGLFAGNITGVISMADYMEGIFFDFRPFVVSYALIKTMVFAFIFTTVSAYFGYITNPKGGAREVGKASTRAVVYSIVTIFIMNLLLTEMILG